jgi:hypothetical protein
MRWPWTALLLIFTKVLARDILHRMIIRINDGRKLNREAQAQIRITAVQRVLDGESPEAVVKSIG